MPAKRSRRRITGTTRASSATRTTKTLKGRAFAPYLLMLIGGLFIFIIGTVSLYFGQAQTFGLFPTWGLMNILGNYNIFYGFMGVFTGALIILAAFHNNQTTDIFKIKVWSTMAFGAALLSLFDTGGLWIGFVFAIVGSIIGLMTK